MLKPSRQSSCRSLAGPVTDAELAEANQANALFGAHSTDPEFGCRFPVDEAEDAGGVMCERSAWRICLDNGWWSAFRKERGQNFQEADLPVHDDSVKRDFSAGGPNQLWPTDVTERKAAERKLYLGAIEDVFSKRIVGCSIDSSMLARLAVQTLQNAVARRGDVAGCIVHSDGGPPFRSRKFVHALNRHGLVGSMGRVSAAGDNAAMANLFALLLQKRPRPAVLGYPGRAEDRHRHLHQKALPSAPAAGPTRAVDPH